MIFGVPAFSNEEAFYTTNGIYYEEKEK